MRGIILAGLILAAGLSACAEQSEKPAILANGITQPQLYEHGRLTAHLQKIASQIGKVAKINVVVTVLDSPIPNGFAWPDGSIYLTRGLVSMARSDEDWADMISHQIAHLIAAKEQRSTLDRVLGLGQSLLDSLMIWESEETAPTAPTLRPFSVAEEATANRIGIRLMIEAGYEVDRVLVGRERVSRLSAYRNRVLGARDAMDGPRLHPLDIGEVVKILASHQREANSSATSNIQVASLLDGLLYGDSVRSGVIKGQTLLHPGLGLAFTLPKDIKLRFDPQGVRAQGPNGVDIRLEASDFRGDASGAVVEWGRPAGLRRAERIVIAERAAATGLLRDAEGIPVARIIALPNEAGQMWRLQISVPGADAQTLTQIAQEVSAVARPLTDTERRQTAPLHLKLGSAPAPAELRRRIVAQPVPEPEALFALLNDLAPGAMPPIGQRIIWVAP